MAIDWQVATNVVGIIVSAMVAYIIYRGQITLSEQLAKQQADLTERLHTNSQQFAQRQLLLPLWEQLKGLRDIDPRDPVWPDVIQAANTLELIALCVEGGIIDQEVFNRAFSGMFLHLARQIWKCQGNVDGRSGMDLLNSNRAARLLHQKLEEADMKHGQLSPLTQGKVA